MSSGGLANRSVAIQHIFLIVSLRAGASFVVSDLLAGLLLGVSVHDPITMIALAALSGTSALAANYIPAYRAENRSYGGR